MYINILNISDFDIEEDRLNLYNKDKFTLASIDINQIKYIEWIYALRQVAINTQAGILYLYIDDKLGKKIMKEVEKYKENEDIIKNSEIIMPRTYELEIKEKQLRENYNTENIMILIKSLSEYLTYHFSSSYVRPSLSSSYVRPSHRLYFINIGLSIIINDNNNKNIGTITTYFNEESKTFKYIITILYEGERRCSNYEQVKSFIELYIQKHIEGK